MKKPLMILSATAIVGLSSCTTTQQQYGAGGALAGGALGAIFGNDRNDVIRGAAVGGAAGVGAAAIQENQNRQAGNYNSGGDAPRPAPQKSATQYPMAIATPEAGVVISPYKPYDKVRVNPSKFPSGSLAKDPTTKQIFRVP